MSFKKDFVWGTATAAYQIEGAHDEDGRTPSVWDIFSHQKGKVNGFHNGDIACDSYHRWKEDIALMKSMGVNAYRFSLSWNRILPDGTGKINEKGMDWYSRLTDELLKNGIEPYVTLFHWDYPYELYLRGGWLNPDSPRWFAEYADAVGRRLGDRVKSFITINEPQCFIGLGHKEGTHAPGLRLDEPDLSHCIHNTLLAHGRANQALRASVDGVKIGYASCGGAFIPQTNSPQDIEAARRAMFGGCGVWDNRMWVDPVYLGIYPETLIKNLGEPKYEEEKTIGEKMDFFGVNIYQAQTVKADENGNPVHVDEPMGCPRTAMNWFVTPDCLYWGARLFAERYKQAVFITENGMSNNDILSSDGKCRDPQRIQYLRSHLGGLKRAADEGIDVGGYFQWSLLDNFEWADGYTQRFGLVYVDYETLVRTPKDSALFYKTVIQTNGECLG